MKTKWYAIGKCIVVELDFNYSYDFLNKIWFLSKFDSFIDHTITSEDILYEMTSNDIYTHLWMTSTVIINEFQMLYVVVG